MQDALYEFLILNNKLSLPGIGTIILRKRSSHHDFGDKQFSSPVFYYEIEAGNDKPSKRLFDWLSSSHGITEWEAIKSVNDFSFELKKRISEAGEMNWENVGVFSRDNAGHLKLTSASINLLSDQPVTAEKMLREKAEHTVLVGEQEKTSAEMEEFFAESSSKRDYLWLIAVALTVLSLLFAGWHFSKKGFDPASSGNQSLIKSN